MSNSRDPRPVHDPRDPRPVTNSRDARPVSDPHPHGSVREALDRAAALRARLQDALRDARRDLASAEETNRALHRELDQMTASTARRWMVGARQTATRAARAVQHPLWTAGTVVRGIAATPGPATARRAFDHLVRRTFPLRLSAPVRRWSEGLDESVAIRWIGPVNLRHRIREAMLCHAPAGLEYQAQAPAGASFVCEFAVSPQVWSAFPPAIEFTFDVSVPSLGWRETVRQSIDPGTRWTDRRWHVARIPLPPTDAPALEVHVSLSTRVAAGTSPGNAWALLGEPRFEWRRRTAEVRSSVQTFARRLRTAGVRSAVELLRTSGIAAHDAEAYSRWIARHTPGAAELAAVAHEMAALPLQPLISVITPVYNTDPQWLRACIDSVRRQVYPNWELCLCDDASSKPETIQTLREYEADPKIRIRYLSINGGISAASNAALAMAHGDFIALLDHDDELRPEALAEVVRHLNRTPDADVFYSDEDKLDLAGGRCDPYFKPGWSPDHFLSCMYTCHLMVIRRTALEEVGGFRSGYEGAQDYDLLLRIVDRPGPTKVEHIPRILYHWRKLPESTASAGLAKPWALDAGKLAIEDHVRRTALDADVLPGGAPGVYRLRRRIRGTPLVSLVIPTSGRPRTADGRTVDVLAQAIRSVVEKTAYREYELVLVLSGNGTPGPLPETTVRALDGTRHRVITLERLGLFNFSASINAGAAAALGEHLVLFNDDLEVISPEWLTALLEYSQEPGVGAVGPKLLYPDGRLQHVGIVLGVAGVAAHAYHQHPGVSPGYGGSVMMARNYSAVTGACLMTRRAVFEEVGRFDERLPTDFNDVDYCLRVQRAGYRVVYTPWSQLYHHESASFGTRQHDMGELEEMRRRWADVIDNDPYYNPNLTRDFPDYRIDA
jgi:GT2 family glycosyltransferase